MRRSHSKDNELEKLREAWRSLIDLLPGLLSYGFPLPLPAPFAFSGAFGTCPPAGGCLRSCFDAPLDWCFAELPTRSPCGCCWILPSGRSFD